MMKCKILYRMGWATLLPDKFCPKWVCDPNGPFLVLYIWFFCMSQNLRKWGKWEAFLICASHFLWFKKFLIINNTEYNFWVFKYLRFKRHPKQEAHGPHRSPEQQFLVTLNLVSYAISILNFETLSGAPVLVQDLWLALTIYNLHYLRMLA